MARTPSSTSTLTSPAPGSGWSFASDGIVACDHDLPSIPDNKLRTTRVAAAQSSFSVPDANEDPLVVRGITWDMEAESLSDLNHIDDTVLGPVWAAKLDGTTPVRVFGLRPTGAARLNTMLDSLHNILREQVLFSRARLARPVGVVLRLVAVGGRDRGGEWVGLVYQCSEADLIGAAPLPVEAEGVSAATPIAGGLSCSQTSDDSSDSDDGTFPPPGPVVPQVIEMVETMLAASRILRSSIITTGVVAFHPAFFINGGIEVACWGLIGGVAWLWLDAGHPLAAPEISDVVLPPLSAAPPPPPPSRPTPAPLSSPLSPPPPPPSRPTPALPATTVVAAQVFALMRFASDLLSASVGSPTRKFAANIRNLLVAGVADDPGGRPSLVEAVYGVLAELVEPERGWSWVHYACKCNDSGAVAAFVAGGGDVNLRALAVDRDHESSLSLMDVACLHGSVDCVSSLLSLGCRLSSKALVFAIHGRNVEVVDLLTPAYTAVETAHFSAVAPDDDAAVFDALLRHLPDAQLDAVFNCCCATLSLRNAACFALLARRGLSLEPPTNATRDLRDELAAAAELVPFGCHPLDCMGRAEGIATTSAGDAGSGHHNVSVRSRRRPTATAAGATLIEVPGWVRVFPWNEFQLADCIGRGAFGEVYRATRREGEAAVAVKMLVSRVINRRVARAFLSEVAAHVRIHHARVLLMHGLVLDDQQSGAMGLVSEYMAGGSLSARLKAARRDDGRVADEFHAGVRARVLLQAAEGISYLHSQRLIHRDIKPANIFLTASGEAKVGDLGFASMAGGREGWTRAYAAPELLLDKVPRSSVSSDVYAFAVTVYETLSLAVLPRGSLRKDGLEYELPWVIAGLRRPTGWWAEVVTRVLETSPANRPSMDALQVPLEALEATREANAGAFFGLVALERWAEALEVVDDPAEAVVAGAHTTALWRAVKARAPVRVLAACVARGCEVDARNDREETPLMWATTAPTVAALLAAGANVEACDEFGCTPLMHASSAGRRQVVIALLEGGARVSAVDDDGWDAMFHASATGNAGIMVVLTTAGALVRTVDLEGCTLLMQAAKSGDRKCVNVLLSAVWDVNVTSRDGRSALLHGAVAGGVGVVKALLLAGSNVNLADQDGRTALMHAAREGHVRVVGELLEASAAVDVLDHGEMSALNHAASMGRVGVIEALAASALRMDARDTDGRTALMRAATHGHVDGCRYLASAGADLEAANGDGRTPLMLAASSGHAEAVAVLLDAGANVEARDCDRATALMLAAAAEGNGEVVSVLLEAGGANVAAADNNGLSAAFYACAAGDGNAEVVAALVSAGADLDQQLVRAVAREANEAALRLLAAGASVGAAHNVDGLVGHCALAHAVTAGGPVLIRALIEAGADVDAVCGDNRQTVLSRAVLACNTAAVRVLLKDGGQADPNARDGNGATALAHAASLGRPVETRLLLAAGAEPNARDSVLGRTPLMRACARGNVDVVAALLASDGISVDGAVDSDGWTALMHAAARGNDGAVAALVAAGAGVNCADSYRQTPTMVGIAHVAVVRILVDAGADVNAADASGQTALMMAAARGGDHMLGVVEALLAAGAVAQAADADGRSALAIALAADHADIARVLQRRVVL